METQQFFRGHTQCIWFSSCDAMSLPKGTHILPCVASPFQPTKQKVISSVISQERTYFRFMNDNKNQFQIRSQVLRCFKSVWKMFVTTSFQSTIQILLVNWLAFLSNYLCLLKNQTVKGLQKASKLQISLDQLKSRSCEKTINQQHVFVATRKLVEISGKKLKAQFLFFFRCQFLWKISCVASILF